MLQVWWKSIWDSVRKTEQLVSKAASDGMIM